MSKARRHHRILELLREHVVESQDQLAELLALDDLAVAQATLSRDLRALGVVKEPQHDGSARYRPSPDDDGQDDAIALANLRAFVSDIDKSGNLLVIKTRVGGAQPAALALDHLRVDGILGTIAGDDTILAVVADSHRADAVVDSLWALIER